MGFLILLSVLVLEPQLLHLLKCLKVTSQLSPKLNTLWKTVKLQDNEGNKQEQHVARLDNQALYKIRLWLPKETSCIVIAFHGLNTGPAGSLSDLLVNIAHKQVSTALNH